MQGRIGIGIVTYNRKDMVHETIECVRRYTVRDDVDFVVADDGSTDGTMAMLRELGVPVVSGVNMGIAWNKNRVLYLLGQLRRCEVVILLEDDTQPNAAGWEEEWIEGARRWGHVNLAGDWLKPGFIRGSGTAEDPIMGRQVTAQCASYSRESLDYGGYYDPRFKGYGHEHVEHSRRLIRVGYGGAEHSDGAEGPLLFAMLTGSVTVLSPPSHYNKEQADRNLAVAHRAMGEQFYRVPWQTDDEMQQFRAEMTSAVRNQPDGFGLRGAAPAAVASPKIQGAAVPLPVPVAMPPVPPAAEAPATVVKAASPASSALDYLRGSGAAPPMPTQVATPPPEPPRRRGFFSRLLGRG
jgi:hypothetical protein